MKSFFLLFFIAQIAWSAPSSCNKCFQCVLNTDHSVAGEAAVNAALMALPGSDTTLQENIIDVDYDTIEMYEMSNECSDNDDDMDSTDDIMDTWPCMSIEFVVFDTDDMENRNVLGLCRVLASSYFFMSENVTDTDEIADFKTFISNRATVANNLLTADENAAVGSITAYVKTCSTDDCNELTNNDKATATTQCGVWDDDDPNFVANMTETIVDIWDSYGPSEIAGYVKTVVDNVYASTTDSARQKRSVVQYAYVTFTIELAPGTDYDSDAVAAAYESAVTQYATDNPDAGIDLTAWNTAPVFTVVEGASSASSLTSGLITLVLAFAAALLRY